MKNYYEHKARTRELKKIEGRKKKLEKKESKSKTQCDVTKRLKKK
jgi:hypothetical protein